MTVSPPSQEELHAFIDGELPPARATEIAAAVEHDAQLARQVAAFRADKVRLKEIYAPLLQKPVPEAWQRMIDPAQLKRPAVMDRRAWMAMAASVVAIVGGWTVYRTLMAENDEAVIAAAIAARGDKTASQETISMADAGALLTQTLGLRLKAPDLTTLGFTLADAHAYDARKAMKLDYRDAQARVFTLYLAPSSGKPRFEMTKRGPLRVCVWQDDVMGTIMVADVSAGEMLRLASLAYSGLNT